MKYIQPHCLQPPSEEASPICHSQRLWRCLEPAPSVSRDIRNSPLSRAYLYFGAGIDIPTMPLSRRSSVRRTNVTACSRCKSRKQRCDQNIPACSACERAGVPCISIDGDGRKVPRSYIKSLEDRVAHLEKCLTSHGVRNYDQDSVAEGSRDDVSSDMSSPARVVQPTTVRSSDAHNDLSRLLVQRTLMAHLGQTISAHVKASLPITVTQNSPSSRTSSC